MNQDATCIEAGLIQATLCEMETQPPREGAQKLPPHFSAHVYCGQTAGWIRIALDTETGLGPGDILADGDPASTTERGTAAPLFGPLYSGTVAHLSNC